MVVPAVTPRRRERLGDQLYGQILEQIVSGVLGEAARLPTETSLCRTFEVSRATVREALARLRADGLVVARQGAGTFVARRPPQALIQLAEPGDIAATLACFEARMALECEAAALAASRRSPNHVARIGSALRGIKAGLDARQPAILADAAFHRAIALASENDYIVALLDALHGPTARWLHIILTITASHTSAERAQRVYDEHLRIAEAIEGSDAERARMLMRYHLDQARGRLTDHHRNA